MKHGTRVYLSVIILLLPAVSFLYIARFSLFDIPTNIFEILVYVVAILALVSQPSWRVFSKNERRVLGATLVLMFIATVISPDKRAALGIVKGWIIPALLVGFMLNRVLKEQKAIDTMLIFFRSSALGLALIALLQQLPYVVNRWSEQMPEVAQYLENHRSVAFYNSPNSLAIVLALGLVISFYLKKTTIDLFSFLIILSGLLATGSRAGIAAGLIGWVMYYLWQKKQHLNAVAVFIATMVIFNPITLSLIALRNPNNADIRVEIWKSSWELISEKPIFGYGLTSFQDAFSTLTLHRINYDEFITPYAVHPHNIFLYTWFLFGIIGLVALVYILTRAFAHLYHQKSRQAALSASLLGIILINGMVDNSLWKNDLIILFIVVLSLVKNTSLAVKEN